MFMIHILHSQLIKHISGTLELVLGQSSALFSVRHCLMTTVMLVNWLLLFGKLANLALRKNIQISNTNHKFEICILCPESMPRASYNSSRRLKCPKYVESILSSQITQIPKYPPPINQHYGT